VKCEYNVQQNARHSQLSHDSWLKTASSSWGIIAGQANKHLALAFSLAKSAWQHGVLDSWQSASWQSLFASSLALTSSCNWVWVLVLVLHRGSVG